ncbi:hypothetical protein [Aegicerativicinus sediminis]|uniref:hypothetical protein n=1 Tax=Aegicerativicinus sediminis TaxID=2893202 RepID=UPI001E5D35B1|nr:hypothetical protein [Aegicerativicinus sediminis]
MFSKPNIIATIATTLWAFFGGYLIWGIIGDPLLSNYVSGPDIMRENPDYFHLLVGCLLMGFAFSTIYGKWANGIFNLASGVKFGFLLALLSGLGEGLIDYSTTNLISISGALLNAVLYFVFYVAMGIIAAMVYRKF